jgi:Flp pilus assembly protein TadG
MTHPVSLRRKHRENGSTLLELAIVFPLMVAMLFGTVGLGVMLGRFITAEQICRDVAHMYSDGVDFSQTNNQNIIVQQLASGTGITATGGNGVIILSQIETVYQKDCTADGINSCTNMGLPVFIQRLYMGNQSLKSSTFGTPTSTLMDSEGNISATVYMTNSDTSVQTGTFIGQLDNAITRSGGTLPSNGTQCGSTTASTTCAMADGDVAFVTEVYIQYPDIGFLGWSTTGGAYVRFIYY